MTHISSVKKLPLISIVTVVKDGENHVEQAIQSVLNQTYTNIEYIVIDGDSKDKTLSIIDRYKSRINFFISEKDSGIANAFNKGISAAKGELIGLLNSDDWYEPNAVETIVNWLDDDHDVYCGNVQLYRDDNFLKVRKSKKELINVGMYIMHPTVFVRKKVYEELGLYDESFKIAMDFDLLLRIAQSKKIKIKYIDQNIANMRTGGASNQVEKMHKEELVAMRKNLKGRDLIIAFLANFLNRLISFIIKLIS